MKNRILTLYDREKSTKAISYDFINRKTDSLAAKYDYIEELKRKYSSDYFDRKPENTIIQPVAPNDKSTAILLQKQYIQTIPSIPVKPKPITTPKPSLALPKMPRFQSEPSLWDRAKSAGKRVWGYIKSLF